MQEKLRNLKHWCIYWYYCLRMGFWYIGPCHDPDGDLDWQEWFECGREYYDGWHWFVRVGKYTISVSF